MNMLQKKLFVCLSLSMFASSSHAALFDDTEARKKILDVESEMQANDQTQAAEIADLKQRLQVQTQSMLDMQNELELFRNEIAQLRGSVEVLQHALETAEQRQKDLYTDTDARIRELENNATAISADDPNAQFGQPGAAETEDIAAYKAAYTLSQDAKHQEAFDAYDSFVKTYPDSQLMPDALYGLGYSQFALKSYKSSIDSQQKLLDNYPDNKKVPYALYSIANSQIQLGQVKSAKATLKKLIADYPNADVIPNAKRRLKVLETIR